MTDDIAWTLANDLVKEREKYHKSFYDLNKFTGPSYHFHIRALHTYGQEKIEMVYALLTSWGMHRMGGATKLVEFDEFKQSLSSVADDIQTLKSVRIQNIADEHFKILEGIFNSLKVMCSGRKLTAFSKTLAHYLPDLIMPVDGEYTLRFINIKSHDILPNKKTVGNNDEFIMFKNIHEHFLKKIANNDDFNRSARVWLDNQKRKIERHKWDTSIPKIIDNLIVGKIGAMKGMNISDSKES